MRQEISHIVDLVSMGLGQNKISDLPEMLKTIARSVDAFGCILWQVAPSPVLDGKQLGDYLFMLGEWFEDDKSCVLHKLPVNRSVSGAAVLSQETINVPDIWKDQRVYKLHPFLKQADIKVMCSIPIHYRDGSHGTANLYRNTAEPFREEEVARAELLSALVPYFYQGLTDKDAFELMVQANEILEANEILYDTEKTSEPPLSSEKIKKTIRRICKIVSTFFHCIETSIFLEDWIEAPGEYSLMGTTWPVGSLAKSYRKGEREGLTSWVLRHARQMVIFDLASFDSDFYVIRSKYPGVSWKHLPNMKEVARKHLNLRYIDDLPPLSFMAAPIIRGDNVRGVIRCSIPMKGRSFTEHECKLLKLIADQIGRFWGSWLSRREIQEENDTWMELVTHISELNSYVQAELKNIMPGSTKNIFKKALRLTGSAIRGAEISDVRLLDEEKQQLYFEEVHGEAWERGTPEEIKKRKEKRFDVNGNPPDSAGAHVLQTGEVYLVPDVNDEKYHYSKTFKDTKRIIVAPITVGSSSNGDNGIFGVLDVRGTDNRDFSRSAEAIAKLLGRQLGLYHHLVLGTRNLHNVVETLERFKKEQIETFADLGHQLKSPIIQAQLRIENALRSSPADAKGHMQAVNGLCGKAKRVSRSIWLLSELSSKEPIGLKKSRLSYDELVKMLIEAAMDNELMAEFHRHIRFSVDRKGFEVLHSNIVEVDSDLLEQAINNLLDNAVKYSYSESVVHIKGGLTGSGRFYISVSNRGFPIYANQVRHCAERRWRGAQALLAVGEGSGIGLYIVDSIMKAHLGELVITPTTEGVTEVRLIFPILKLR
jgi:signal transduction histidine kinase